MIYNHSAADPSALSELEEIMLTKQLTLLSGLLDGFERILKTWPCWKTGFKLV